MSKVFQRTLAHKATKSLAFNPEWLDRHGRPVHAVRGEIAPKLGLGEIAKTCCTHNRPMLIVGTMCGNVIVFQRYADNTETFVFEAPQAVTNLFSPTLVHVGKMNEEEILLVLGNVEYAEQSPNIGTRLSVFLNAVVAPVIRNTLKSAFEALKLKNEDAE